MEFNRLGLNIEAFILFYVLNIFLLTTNSLFSKELESIEVKEENLTSSRIFNQKFGNENLVDDKSGYHLCLKLRPYCRRCEKSFNSYKILCQDQKVFDEIKQFQSSRTEPILFHQTVFKGENLGRNIDIIKYPLY